MQTFKRIQVIHNFLIFTSKFRAGLIDAQVRCSRCNIMLIPPANVIYYACPCGQTIRSQFSPTIASTSKREIFDLPLTRGPSCLHLPARFVDIYTLQFDRHIDRSRFRSINQYVACMSYVRCINDTWPFAGTPTKKPPFKTTKSFSPFSGRPPQPSTLAMPPPMTKPRPNQTIKMYVCLWCMCVSLAKRRSA